MAQRTSQEVVDVGSHLPSGTARLDLSPAMLRDGSTPTSDRKVPLSQGRTVLYATRPKTPARLIRATRSRAPRSCSSVSSHCPPGCRHGKNLYPHRVARRRRACSVFIRSRLTLAKVARPCASHDLSEIVALKQPVVSESCHEAGRRLVCAYLIQPRQ